MVVPSYLAGRWQAGSGDGRPMHDAVTAEEGGRLSTSGLDLAGAAAYARSVGGPALRDLSFHISSQYSRIPDDSDASIMTADRTKGRCANPAIPRLDKPEQSF